MKTWKRYPGNPILPLRPGRFDANHVHAPAVVRDGGRYRMWYSGSDAEKNEFHRIGYAESRDGFRWERLDEPVLIPADPAGYYTTPAVLREATGDLRREDGLFKMWFTGNNHMCDLHLAISPDGIRWDLVTPDPLGFPCYCPTVVFDEGVYKMWFTLADESGDMAIHYATSSDGLAWTPHGLALRPDRPWERRHVLYPFVLKRDRTYELYYTSYDRICELAVARSEDGIHWEKDSGSLLSPEPDSAYDSLYCSRASVVLEPDGRDKLYYASRIDMQHKYYAIALATAAV